MLFSVCGPTGAIVTSWCQVTVGKGWRVGTPTGDGLDGKACHNTAVLYSHGTAAEN